VIAVVVAIIEGVTVIAIVVTIIESVTMIAVVVAIIESVTLIAIVVAITVMQLFVFTELLHNSCNADYSDIRN
jgi:hypothetical protein